jgi:hypothetical protein
MLHILPKWENMLAQNVRKDLPPNRSCIGNLSLHYNYNILLPELKWLPTSEDGSILDM